MISAQSKLCSPREQSDKAHEMLKHGRSLDEVAEVTKLSLYLVRRLRQELMAAQIQNRNKKVSTADSQIAGSRSD